MATHTLTLTLTDAGETGLEDVEYVIRPAVDTRVAPVGGNAVVPISVIGRTDRDGVGTADLLSSVDLGCDYTLEVTVPGGDGGPELAKTSSTFSMPDADTTLAAALTYTATQPVLLPVQGWRTTETQPVTPGTGDGWFQASTGELRVYDGDEWRAVTNAADIETRLAAAELLTDRFRVLEVDDDVLTEAEFIGLSSQPLLPNDLHLAIEAAITSPSTGDQLLLFHAGSNDWKLLSWDSTTHQWFVFLDPAAVFEVTRDVSTVTSRIDTNETAIATNAAAIAALQAGGSSAAGGLRHVEVPAIQHTTSFGLGDRVSNAVGAALYALDPPVEVGELVFVYQPDGDGDPDPHGWTIAVRVDDAATTAPFTQSTQFLQVLTAPMVGELEANTSFVSRLDALEAGGISVGTTAPTSPSDGALWFDPTNLQLHTWNADETRWEIVAASGDHERIDAVEVTAGQAAASAATNAAAVATNITNIGSLTSRVSTLEAVDTSEQLVSPVTYNAAEHTLTLHHVDGTNEVVTLGDASLVETLTTSDDEVAIAFYAGLGGDTDVYEQAARAEDGHETPPLDIASDPTNGAVLRNTSDTFVAGLSFLGEGVPDGGSVFLLGKFNIGTEDQPYQHTLIANYEVAVALEARASETRLIITPTGESSTTLTFPVAVGTNGVGDFIFGIQFTDPSNSNVAVTAAINGVISATTATSIASMPELRWSTRTNIGCRWNTPLQDTPSINTFHLIGDAWDVVSGSRETAWSPADFAALTATTTTPPDNRTQLYGGDFSVADAPIFARGIHWSERATMPVDRNDDATVHHLRTYIPVERATELVLDVAATRQTTHDPQTYLTLPDVTRLRRAFVDLGDDTIGAAGIAADVTIDRAKLDEWVIADRAVTVTQLRGAPIWQLAAGWPSNYYIDTDEFHTWAACLVRANATDDGCPEGHANYLAIAGYIGTSPTGASERWMRVGVRT